MTSEHITITLVERVLVALDVAVPVALVVRVLVALGVVVPVALDVLVLVALDVVVPVALDVGVLVALGEPEGAARQGSATPLAENAAGTTDRLSRLSPQQTNPPAADRAQRWVSPAAKAI